MLTPFRQTLQKYTREYLFEKFKAEVQPPPPVSVRAAPPAAVARLPPMRGSRPILAIDTAPSHANPNGHAPLPAPRPTVPLNGELQSAPMVTMHELPEKMATTSASQSPPLFFLRVLKPDGETAEVDVRVTAVWGCACQDRLLTRGCSLPQDPSGSAPKRLR